MLGDGGVLADGRPHEVLDGSLFFSTQINRLLRHPLPGVLHEDEVDMGGVPRSERRAPRPVAPWLRRHAAGLLAGLLVCIGALLAVGASSIPQASTGASMSPFVGAVVLVGVVCRRTARRDCVGARALAGRRPRRPGDRQPRALRLAAQRQAGDLHRARLGRRAGPGPGFMVGATTALVSNLFFGQGPWTPWQMLAWGVVGAAGGLLGLRRRAGRAAGSSSSSGRLRALAFDWFVTLWMFSPSRPAPGRP